MTLEPKPSLSIKSSIADRLSRLATLAWLPALLISIASLIVSGVSLSYTASNYHLQISGQKADLEISDIKIANPYDKASLFFDLRNEGKLPSGIASLRFSSFLPDGTAKVLIAPVYNASPIYNGNPRRHEDKEIDMKKFTGWLGVCLEYSDDTTGGHQQAYVFFFKDLQVGLDVKTGGAGEYSADQIINKSLLVVPCEI